MLPEGSRLLGAWARLLGDCSEILEKMLREFWVFGFEILGVWHEMLGVWHTMLGVWHRKLGVWHTKLGVWLRCWGNPHVV